MQSSAQPATREPHAYRTRYDGVRILYNALSAYSTLFFLAEFTSFPSMLNPADYPVPQKIKYTITLMGLSSFVNSVLDAAVFTDWNSRAEVYGAVKNQLLGGMLGCVTALGVGELVGLGASLSGYVDPQIPNGKATMDALAMAAFSAVGYAAYSIGVESFVPQARKITQRMSLPHLFSVYLLTAFRSVAFNQMGTFYRHNAGEIEGLDKHTSYLVLFNLLSRGVRYLAYVSHPKEMLVIDDAPCATPDEIQRRHQANEKANVAEVGLAAFRELFTNGLLYGAALGTSFAFYPFDKSCDRVNPSVNCAQEFAIALILFDSICNAVIQGGLFLREVACRAYVERNQACLFPSLSRRNRNRNREYASLLDETLPPEQASTLQPEQASIANAPSLHFAVKP